MRDFKLGTFTQNNNIITLNFSGFELRGHPFNASVCITQENAILQLIPQNDKEAKVVRDHCSVIAEFDAQDGEQPTEIFEIVARAINRLARDAGIIYCQTMERCGEADDWGLKGNLQLLYYLFKTETMDMIRDAIKDDDIRVWITSVKRMEASE